MDRVTTYALALGRSTDFLQAQQNTMVGNAYTDQAFLGTQVAVDGLSLTPTNPASMVLTLGLGAVYQPQNLEATSWSSLPANLTSNIVKQGLLQAVDPITFTAPTTVGYAQNFLVEVQYADLDTSPVLLPFYNSAAPGTPYQGPNNSGVSSSTARQGIVAVQVKAGTAATSGTQTTPTPDAGWTGLYVVTVPANATSLTAGSIAVYPGAPFLPVRLPGVPQGVQSGQWVYGAATGTNTYTTSLFSLSTYPYARYVGMEILIFFGNPNTTTTPTLAENGQPAAQVRRSNGGTTAVGDLSGFLPLVWDGTYFRVNGFVTSDVASIAKSAIYRPTRVGPFTAPGSWSWTAPSTMPANTPVLWELWGGGAGGGYAGSKGGAAGGGAGAYRPKVLIMNPGDVVSGTVGAAGAAGVAGSNGGSGTATTLTFGGVTYSAGGGSAPLNANANQATNSAAGGTYDGNGIDGVDPANGGVSDGGLLGYSGSALLPYGGKGGDSPKGGPGGRGGTGNANSGQAPGGGGGGGADTGTAGTGAVGQVRGSY